MRKFKRFIRRFFRISFMDYGTLVTIEWWKFHIEVYSPFESTSIHWHISSPCIQYVRKNYKNRQHEIFISIVMFEILITYDKTFTLKDEYND